MQHITRRRLLRSGALAGASLMLAACQPKVVEKIVKETVVVKEVVSETVVVKEAVQVEKEVTRVVEKQVTAVPVAKEPVSLVLPVRQGQHVGNCFVERLPSFLERYPDIKLSIDEVPGARVGYWTKVKTMLAGQTIGDLINGPPHQLDYYQIAFKGALLALDSIVEAEKFDLDQYYPTSVQDCRLEGKLYGIPFEDHGGMVLMYYNMDWFDKLGVPYPTEDWTIEDLAITASKLTHEAEVSGQKVMMYGFVNSINLFSLPVYHRIFGGEFLSPDGKKVLLDSEAGLAYAQLLYDLRMKYKGAPPPEVGTGSALYVTDGRCAMADMHYLGLTTWRKQVGDRWRQGVTLMPKTPAGRIPSERQSDAMSITSTAKHVPEAWEVVKFYTSYEHGVLKVLGGCSSPGARPDCWADRRVFEAIPGHDLAKRAMEENAPFVPLWNFRGTEFEAVLPPAFQELYKGDTKPEEWVAKTTKALQEVADKPR